MLDIVKYVKTGHGNSKLCYKGYFYIRDKSIKSKIYWICEERKSLNCHGRAISITENNIDEIKETVDHNHVPSPNRWKVLKTLNKIDKRAEKSTEMPEIIVQNVKRRLNEYELNDLMNDSSLKKTSKKASY